MNNIIYSKDLYSKTVLNKAIIAFKEICNVSITESNSYFICVFEIKNNYPQDMTIKEFENYMINLINSEKLYNDY